MSSKAARRVTDFRRRKRRFQGNQHTKNEVIDVDTNVFDASPSAKKIRLECPMEEKVDVSHQYNGYRLINIDILTTELSNFLICFNCKSKAVLKEKTVYGLASEFYVECKSCSIISSFKSSPTLESSVHNYEVNHRVIYAMRTVGLGLCGLRNFCAAMDLPPPVSQNSYDKAVQKIQLATLEEASESMKKAVNEEISATGNNEICVSGDGTWKTRGHTSRIGVCSLIGDETGKVLDIEVLSSFCKGCEKWKGSKCGKKYDEWKLKHKNKCVKNHSGSSGKMEVDGMKRIFERSETERNAKYVKYIGDGDTKTFPEIQNSAPYNVEKVECVGHVQKRMGNRLRKLKLVNRGRKLSDGKGISGKNRLTDKIIDKFTTYYGNAIRGNSNSIEDMRKAIWAIFCHYKSTDNEPMHHFCPDGDKSWCDYQRAKFTNSVASYKHKNVVPIPVMDEIKPIFAELSSPKLLKRCLGGKTQNANESFNSTIWKYLPKTSGASKVIADIAANEAAVIFNDGMAGRLKIMKRLGFKVGHFSSSSAFKADFARVRNAEIKLKSSTLEARRANRMRKKSMHEHFVQIEGSTYDSGAF